MSDSQSLNRLDFLTDYERDYIKGIMDEAKASEFDPKTLNGRLLQVRHTLNALNKAVRKELDGGASEDSLVVKEMSDKIMVLIKQEEELSALVGQESKLVA